MELLLHYVWKHRLFPLEPLLTTDGQIVEVIDPGLHNTNAGPDFFNAKVKINGVLWAGNVEIHDKASDWYAHRHDSDPRYNNVVLHVCETIDAVARTADGTQPPQVRMTVPREVIDNFRQLLHADKYPPCYRLIPALSKLTAHAWMNALQVERLEEKTDAIRRRVAACAGSWEAAFFITLARTFGFGINNDTFETWAMSIPFGDLAHQRDDVFQTECIFIGQAGLANINAVPRQYQDAAARDEYFRKVCAEYAYLSHKFQLTPIDHRLWRFLRLRPQNFPYIRLSQLAHLYCAGGLRLSRITECRTAEESLRLLATQATPYWQTHYIFGAESARNEKHLSKASLNIIAINVVAPILFAYGRHRADDRLTARALDFLDQLKVENNNIVRMWRECGLDALTAGDSQALIQLKREYCDKKNCLRCRIGYEYLKQPHKQS